MCILTSFRPSPSFFPVSFFYTKSSFLITKDEQIDLALSIAFSLYFPLVRFFCFFLLFFPPYFHG